MHVHSLLSLHRFALFLLSNSVELKIPPTEFSICAKNIFVCACVYLRGRVCICFIFRVNAFVFLLHVYCVVYACVCVSVEVCENRCACVHV
jgi:hypothetical protein